METTEIMQHIYGKSYFEVIDGLTVDEDQGGCCGYSVWDVTDEVLPLSDEDKNSAVLKSVVNINYGEGCGDRQVVNFVFNVPNKGDFVLGYDLRAGSGSGWGYGAYCTLNFNSEEIITASW